MANRTDDGPDDVDVDGTGDTDRPRWLFPVDGDRSDALLPLVCDLVQDSGGELFVASPVTVPEQTPLETPGLGEDGRRRAAQYVLQARQECGEDLPIQEVVRIGHQRGHVLTDIVEDYDISTLVTQDTPRSGITSILGAESVDAAVTDACDTVVVTRIGEREEIESVLVPIAPGPHSGMAVETGLAIARQNHASLELFHVAQAGDEERRAAGEDVLDAGMERVGDYDRASRTLRAAEDVTESIVEYADPYDVTVLGAPREGLLRQYALGTIPDDVSARSTGTIAVAHRGAADGSWLERWI